MKKLFVWDFHGVLEKGNDAALLKFTNQTLESHGFTRRMTIEETELLAGRRWHEYFSYLLPELTQQECFKLQETAMNYSHTQRDVLSEHVRLNEHAQYVLEMISKTPHTQILISNSHPDTLDMFVDLVGVGKYFPGSKRFGVNTSHPSKMNKLECLKLFVEDKHFPGGIVSIGDSPTDMSLIHHHPQGVGYLYTHPGRTHRPAECHYKIHDLRHVLQEIKAPVNAKV